MKTILALLFITSLLVRPARADVYIYRGPIKISADLASAAPFGDNISLYFVVDYDGGQVGSLVFGRINGGKHFSRGSASTYRFGTASVANGRTESYFGTSTSTNTSATDFNFTTTLFRGTDKSLLIRKTPSATLVNRPPVLKGVGIGLSSNSTFADERFGLTFLGAATIKANNANQTIDQALDDLVTALTAKGFTSL